MATNLDAYGGCDSAGELRDPERVAPPVPPLAVEVQRAGTSALILLCGELDVLGAPLLAEAADDALGAPCERLIISCEGLTFVDCCGLRALLGVRAACAGTETKVYLVRRTAFLDRLLALSGLDRLFG